MIDSFVTMSAWQGAFPPPNNNGRPASTFHVYGSQPPAYDQRRTVPGVFAPAPGRFIYSKNDATAHQGAGAPSPNLQEDYQKLFGSQSKTPVQLIPSSNLSKLPPAVAATRAAVGISSKLREKEQAHKEQSSRNKWDREPAEASDKVKELQQSLSCAEKKIQELQDTVAKCDARAGDANKKERQLSDALSSASGDFEQLRGDYEMLKAEIIYAHRELEVIVDENTKLKSLGSQSEQALLQAAALLKKSQSSRVQEASSVQLSELTAKQAELDTAQSQLDSARSTVTMLKLDLRAKENQLRDTMGFNKKSMAASVKLNECVKQQEKELAELRWSKGMLENELKEKNIKIDALQLSQFAPPPPPIPPASAADLAAKEKELQELKAQLQESNKTVAKLKQEQNIRIPWNTCKLTASAQEYMAQLADRPQSSGTKRKLESAEISDEPAQLNKCMLRNVLISETDIAQDVNKAMSEQQTAVAKVQHSLLQQQKSLREAQDDLEANYVRKRCLEARAKVLREQEGLVLKFLNSVKAACQAGEQIVAPLKEQVSRLVSELEQKRAALIDTQISSTELEVEGRIRSEAKGKPSSQRS